MRDGFGRNIDYLRVSITDRCNLRCRYCMPEDLPSIPHPDILRYEELEQVCAIAAGLGVRTVRVTGGEPLVRRGCVDFLARLKAIPGIDHVTLTTNGVLLARWADRLAALGLDGVNVSLDTLEPERYRHMTGRDDFAQAWAGLEAVLAAGLPVKINCVPLRGHNEEELEAIAGLAERLPVDVRFIETMPMGAEIFDPIPGGEILARLRAVYPDLRENGASRGFGPARYYTSKALRGSVGFIDAVSHRFCESCNRVRLTSEGFLKLCLYHGHGVDLRALLRGGADDDAIAAAMTTAILVKPSEHHFFAADPAREPRRMWQIGG